MELYAVLNRKFLTSFVSGVVEAVVNEGLRDEKVKVFNGWDHAMTLIALPSILKL